jgi:hypothetical protein
MSKNQGKSAGPSRTSSTPTNPTATLGTSLHGFHHTATQNKSRFRRDCCICRHLFQDGTLCPYQNHSHSTRHCSHILRSNLQTTRPSKIHCLRPRCQVHQLFLANIIPIHGHQTRNVNSIPSANRWSNRTSQQNFGRHVTSFCQLLTR